MKKYIIFLFSGVLVFSFLSLNGCILDALNSINVNMPFTAHIDVSGSQTNISQSKTFDISKSSVYQRYKDKINAITYVKSQFRVTSVSNSNISGDITITLKDKNGITLFTKTLNNVKPADYMKNPLTLELTKSQIQLFNNYLKLTGNTIFTGSVKVDNISGGTAPRKIGVDIDIAFNIDAKT